MHQALLIFVALPVVYSIGFFGWCYLAEKKPVFSRRNSRSASVVMCGHVAVLLILVMLAQTAFRFFPTLPSWFTYEWIVLSRVGERWSYFEILCIVFVLIIGGAETRWIFVDSGRDDSELQDVPS